MGGHQHLRKVLLDVDGGQGKVLVAAVYAHGVGALPLGKGPGIGLVDNGECPEEILLQRLHRACAAPARRNRRNAGERGNLPAQGLKLVAGELGGAIARIEIDTAALDIKTGRREAAAKDTTQPLDHPANKTAAVAPLRSNLAITAADGVVGQIWLPGGLAHVKK